MLCRTGDFDYSPHMNVIKVTQNGTMSWRAWHCVFLSQSLPGKYIGVEQIGDVIWKICYRSVFLVYFYEKGF